MSDAYFKRMAGNYAPYLLEAKDDKAAFEQALFIFAKEISRDTRHKAADMAGQFQQQLENMQLE